VALVEDAAAAAAEVAEVAAEEEDVDKI
jgi:hypothetical protein